MPNDSKPVSSELKNKLVALAQKYEVESFTKEDPSQFLRWYDVQKDSSSVADVECAAFIAAMLSFGSRTQFIPKIRSILELADKTSGNITTWLLAGAPGFSTGTAKFYRFYSYDDLISLFETLSDILKKSGSLGEYLKECYNIRKCSLADIISMEFPKACIVPKGRTSANKRIHMFLRWMVRTNSPVDLGLWTWYSPSNLLIPLDIHVMHEAINLGMLSSSAKPTRKTAENLTIMLEQVFPQDPVRADFALFGLGVNSE